MKPKRIKNLQARSRDLKAMMLNPHTVVVESRTDDLANHVVTVSYDKDGTIHARCTCPWAEHNGVGCAHVMAALEHLAARKGRTLSFWLTQEEAQRQKQRTFYLAGQQDGVWITSRNE